MMKGTAQILEPSMNLPAMNVQGSLEASFPVKESSAETSITETISEKLNFKVRFARLKKRMRTRSSNIL